MLRMSILILLIALFLGACSSPQSTPLPVELPTKPVDRPTESVETSTESASPPSGTIEYYPLDTKTGIPEVDQVLAAVASGSPEELYGLVNYTTAPCTTADGLGGPPKCREGEAEGTELQVLAFIGSEGGHIRKDEVSNWQGVKADGLYAVYRVSENALNEEYYPPGEYLIIFKPQEDGTTSALRVGGGGIVRVDTYFGDFPDTIQTIIDRDTSEVILAPKFR